MQKILQERPLGCAPASKIKDSNTITSDQLDTVPNPRGDIKAITTRSGNVLAGPSVPPPPLSSSSKESSPSSRSSEIHLPTTFSSELPKRNPHQPPIPYPSRLNKEKLQDKSDIQVQSFLSNVQETFHFNNSLGPKL
ncbi:hypothetical protein Tco_0887407 [Tanacetum coccineum]